jgi:transposase
LKDQVNVTAFSVYSNWLVQELHLTMQRVRDLADSFPFYQRRKDTGRPPASERDLMVCYLVRQIFNATFRQTQGLLNYLADYFDIQTIPDHTVLSKYNRSQRWLRIWQRFHEFVMATLPKRKVVIATDATGFSGRKRPWREWPHAAKANQNWVKMHTAIETETFYILSYQLTESNVHDSQMFEQVWQHLPSNVEPTMSLADSAYNGNLVIETAWKHGAWPLHGIKKNAVYRRSPKNAYQRMVQFFFNFPRTYATFYGKRNHAEAAFSMLGNRFGYRIRARSKIGRKNEVQCKVVCYNIRMLAWNSIKVPVRV